MRRKRERGREYWTKNVLQRAGGGVTTVPSLSEDLLGTVIRFVRTFSPSLPLPPPLLFLIPPITF